MVDYKLQLDYLPIVISDAALLPEKAGNKINSNKNKQKWLFFVQVGILGVGLLCKNSKYYSEFLMIRLRCSFSKMNSWTIR